jgi:hypothetical protein
VETPSIHEGLGTVVRLGAFTVVDASPNRADGDVGRVAEVVRLAEEVEAAGLSSLGRRAPLPRRRCLPVAPGPPRRVP